jgi:hypothetical protein
MTTKERRPLTEGLKEEPEVPSHVAREFVFQKQQPVKTPPAPDAKPATDTRLPAGTLNPAAASALVPLTARIPAEKFQALKRASFERQLQGVEPSSLQDIVEEAITPWLKKHGYLS